jgi:polysaccharide deacetylase family protein (PEP-CTERM system associated)
MKILTFDIEEWFHIIDNASTKTEKNWMGYQDRLIANVERILSFLQIAELNATFFCIGWIARKYPTVIKRIDSLGYEIGSHSDLHQLAYEQNKTEFKNDLENSIYSIEDITGKKVRSYRAPGFSIKEENLWVFDAMIESGIEIDSSIFPSKRAHGGFKSFGQAEPALISINGKIIKEFPINMCSIIKKNFAFSGGGYFRLLPYFIIRNFMKKSNYVMTYFHPRDFDPEQPIISDLPVIRKFKSYYGLKRAFKKLRKITKEFNWIDLRKADSLIDWENTKMIQLEKYYKSTAKTLKPRNALNS